MRQNRSRGANVTSLSILWARWLRVLVTAASVGAREGGKCVLKKTKRMGKAVSRVHTIWVDGGYDGNPFLVWVIHVCRWIGAVVLRPEQTKGFVLLKKRACG